MTVVLIVMSGMDPHTISVTWVGMVRCWELVSLVLRSSYRSGLYGMFDVTFKGEELLVLVIAAWHRMQPPLSASLKPQSAFPCLKHTCHDFPTLPE
jgi:hypothetical protein